MDDHYYDNWFLLKTSYILATFMKNNLPAQHIGYWPTTFTIISELHHTLIPKLNTFWTTLQPITMTDNLTEGNPNYTICSKINVSYEINAALNFLQIVIEQRWHDALPMNPFCKSTTYLRLFTVNNEAANLCYLHEDLKKIHYTHLPTFRSVRTIVTLLKECRDVFFWEYIIQTRDRALFLLLFINLIQCIFSLIYKI